MVERKTENLEVISSILISGIYEAKKINYIFIDDSFF